MRVQHNLQTSDVITLTLTDIVRLLIGKQLHSSGVTIRMEGA